MSLLGCLCQLYMKKPLCGEGTKIYLLTGNVIVIGFVLLGW